MTRHISRPRRLVGAAVLLIGVLALGACGPGSSPTSSTSSAATTSAPSSSDASAGAGAQSGATTGAGSSAADRLAAAFTAMTGGYTYTATVTVGSTATVSVAKGRSVGGSSEFVLTSGGKSVTYRAIPPKAWVKQSGGAWVVVSGKVPSGSPLAGLMGPSTITVVADTADGLSLDASYPPAALGLTGDKAVGVHLVVAPGGIVTATFETAVGTAPAASTSIFTPVSGLAAIAAP